MPLETPTVLLGFLLPWAWGISSQLLQQSAATAPYLGRGVSPTAPSDLECGIAPLGPPVPTQPLLLGRGVGPPGHRPWSWAWAYSSRPLSLTLDLGSCSQPFLRHHNLALSAAAPDLGRGVTPLGCRPSGMGSSRLLPLTSDMG